MSWIIQSLIASYPPPSSVWSGLVAYYKLDSNSNDSVGSNNGTDTNVSYVTGKINNAASFNGTNSYFTLGTGFYDNLKTINTYAISMWINPTSLTWWAVLYSYTAAVDFYAYFSATGKIIMRRWATSNSETWTSVSSGSWQHFVFNYTSSSNVAIYKNGSFVQNITVASTPNTTSSFNFGKYYDATFPYNWLQDEIWVWTRSLSASEVTTLYNSGSGITY